MALSIQDAAAGLLGRFHFPVRYPATAIEIAPDAVAAVRLRSDRSGKSLAGYGIVPLSVSPTEVATGPHVAPHLKPGSAAELKRAISEAILSAGIRPGKASLLIPDSLARVWLLQLPELPRGGAAMVEMIRWKIKRGVTTRVEDNVISWQILARPSGNDPAVVLVGLVPRALVAEYEGLLASVGLKVGLVDIASFNLFNAYRPAIGANGGPAGDFAFINATESYFTLMLFRKSELVFYRCKSHAEGEAGRPEERARTFRRELATSLSYYTEKLKGVRIERTFVRIADPALEDAGPVLDSLGFGRIEAIDPSKIANLPGEIHESTARYLATAMGAASGRRA
jgi:hypothetical protein